jgi:hypothetical protein
MNHFSHPRNEPFEKVGTYIVSGKLRKCFVSRQCTSNEVLNLDHAIVMR